MIVTLILVALFYILKAFSDKLLFHFYESIFVKLPSKYHAFWNPELSWRNKWKNGNKADGEKFFGSSTIFVMFTDMWHIIKFLQYNIITLIIVLNTEHYFNIYIDYVLYLTIGLSIFELIFNKLLIKK